MKRVTCLLLSTIIFTLSVFGCYSTAYAAGGSGGSFDNSGLYDTVYGSGNWCIDSDGKLQPAINGQQCTFEEAYANQVDNNYITKFTDFLCANSGITGLTKPTVTKLRRTGKLFDWFNDNKDSISLANGKLQLGKSGISAWRDVFRNNCYDLGSYKLITNNITNDQLLNSISAISGPATDKIQSNVIEKYNCYFVSSQSNYPFVINAFDNKSSSSVEYFCIWDTFSTSTYTSLKFCTFDGTNFSFGLSNLLCCYKVDSSGSYHYIGTGSYTIYPNRDNYMYHGMPLKIFPSQTSAKYYYGVLNSDSELSVYQYNNYSPTNINIDLNTYNSTDYTKINNTIYNSINQQKNEYITNNQTITENDLQLIIEKTINQYIDTQPDTPSETPGGGGGSGGGGSGGGDSSGGSSSGKDYTTLLEDIKQFLNVISSKIEGQTSVHLNTQQIINDIKTLLTDYTKSVTDSFTSLLNKLDDMKKVLDDLLDGQGGSLFDKIVGLLMNVVQEFFTQFIQEMYNTFIGDVNITELVKGPATALASQAQSKFPTSIPWDIIAIIQIMAAEPECPKIDIPFKVERLGINYTIKIDLEQAENLAKLSRNMLSVTFIFFLVVQTRKLYGAMSKN